MQHGASPKSLPADLLELAKPRITSLVTLTTAAGFAVAQPKGLFPWMLFSHTVVGTALVAAGSASLNQWLERELDRRMRRTAARPLPSGRRRPPLALAWGLLLGLAGMLELGLFVNLLTALLAVGTFVAYVLAYTPLKTRSELATVVGAIPGAMPPVLVWTGATGTLGVDA